MKRLVYVATPYDTMLKIGFGMEEVLKEAHDGTSKANGIFKPKFEVFSPVLEWGLKHKDTRREDAMAMCFDKLKEADILYIPLQICTLNSKGIAAEYEFAKKHGICVIFEINQTRALFDMDLEDKE